jgi:cell division protein FtsB
MRSNAAGWRACTVLPVVIAVTGVTLLLSGCGGGASQAELAQAKQQGAQAQAQKESIKAQQDTEASLAAEVKKLKDDATKAADAKTAAAKAVAAVEAAKARLPLTRSLRQKQPQPMLR